MLQSKQKIFILGAGIVGAAIAYELSQLEQFEVTVLDEAQPAQGSTAAALGVLMGVISHKLKGRAWQLRQRSMQRFPQLLKELAQAGHPVPHNRDGIVKLLRDTETMTKSDRLREARAADGWKLAVWSKEMLTSQCPGVNPQGVVGAIFSPQDYQVQPVPLTESLLAVATRQGVHCQFDVSSLRIDYGQQQCRGIHTELGYYPCDWLIVSAGLGTLDLLKPLGSQLSLGPVLGQAFHLKVDPKLLPKTPFQPVLSFDDIHVIPLGKGEYWVGATVEFPDHTGEVQADPQLAQRILQRAIAFYPALAHAQVLRQWSGKRPRPNGEGAPVLKRLAGYENILLATGHYRNGVLLAPATALKIRDWLLSPMLIPT